MKPIKKQLVVVTFWDHYETNGEDIRLIKCEVPGFLVGEDDKAIYLVYWLCDNEINNTNTDIIALVKHNGMVINKAQITKVKYKLGKPKRIKID